MSTEEVKEVKTLKKKTIPKVLKDHTWAKWVGDDVAKTKCMCCELNEIKMNSFHCGHVIAEVNGGITSIENLRPICSACNLSMKTENMDDFKKRCDFTKENASEKPKKKTVKAKKEESVEIVIPETDEELVWEEGIEKRVLPKILTIPTEKAPGYNFTLEVKGAREKMKEQLKDLYILLEYCPQNFHFVRRNKKYETSPKTEESLVWESGTLERVRPKFIKLDNKDNFTRMEISLFYKEKYEKMKNEILGYYKEGSWVGTFNRID